MEKVNFYVVGEHTLGYVHPAQPQILQILHGSVLRGATATWKDGSIALPMDAKDYRPATRQDFVDYRIHSEGYERDTDHCNFPTE